MNRRRVLRLAAAVVGCVAVPVAAHTPYGQWKAYRQKHLTIGCHRDDPATYELAKSIVAALADALPEASARVARGPTAGRLASLLGTDQMHVAILGDEDAAAMAAGRGALAPYGSIPLRYVVRVDDTHVLVAVRDMPDRHVRLVAHALLESGLVPDLRAPPPAGLERHPGTGALPEG